VEDTTIEAPPRERHQLDETPITMTLPAHAWTTLRGAARRIARSDRRASRFRERLLPGRDLDLERAEKLDAIAEQIDEKLASGDTAAPATEAANRGDRSCS
jgi:hypothetical protein